MEPSKSALDKELFFKYYKALELMINLSENFVELVEDK